VGGSLLPTEGGRWEEIIKDRGNRSAGSHDSKGPRRETHWKAANAKNRVVAFLEGGELLALLPLGK